MLQEASNALTNCTAQEHLWRFLVQGLVAVVWFGFAFFKSVVFWILHAKNLGFHVKPPAQQRVTD